MSQQNVEVIRRFVTALYEGRDAVGRLVRRLVQQLRSRRPVRREGDDRIGRRRRAPGRRSHARGRISDVEVHATLVWLYRFRRGKIARVEGYASRAEALEAVRLTE
jgi:ketosteroid isomerase-like protein